MAGTGTQLVESFAHAIPDIAHPIEGGATAAVAAVAMMMVKLGFDKTSDQYATDETNSAQWEHSIKKVDAKAADPNAAATPDVKGNDKARRIPIALLLSGLSIWSVNHFAKPFYNTTHVDDDSNVVAVIQESYTDIDTRDVGDLDGVQVTRAEAVAKGIDSTSYKGNLAVIQAGAGSTPVINLSKNWQRHESLISETQVDPNGADVVSALQEAEKLLPLSNSKDSQTHEGTIVMVSDNPASNTAGQMSSEASTLAAAGIKVRVVVPGTVSGSYKLNPTSPAVSSQTDPSIFAPFGNNNVEQASDAQAIVGDVSQDIYDAGNVERREPWTPIGDLGLAVMGVGIVAVVRQHIKGRV